MLQPNLKYRSTIRTSSAFSDVGSSQLMTSRSSHHCTSLRTLWRYQVEGSLTSHVRTLGRTHRRSEGAKATRQTIAQKLGIEPSLGPRLTCIKHSQQAWPLSDVARNNGKDLLIKSMWLGYESFARTFTEVRRSSRRACRLRRGPLLCMQSFK